MSSWCANRAAAKCRRNFCTDPLIYQGGSDSFLGPRDPILAGRRRLGHRLRGRSRGDYRRRADGRRPEQAAAADPAGHAGQRCVAAQPDPGRACQGVRLFPEQAADRPSRPVAVTPDELGAAWDGGQAAPAAHVDLNGGRSGGPMPARHDLRFPGADRPRGQDPAARRGHDHRLGHRLQAEPGGRPGRPIAEGGVGYSCIAEMRTVETLAGGRASTPLLRHGDRVRIEMKDRQARSIFGAIEQTVARPNEV